MPQVVEIIGGPGHMDMAYSLFKGNPIVFTLKTGEMLRIVLSSVEMESGSRESWNLKGRSTSGEYLNKIYYSTRQNRGTVSRE